MKYIIVCLLTFTFTSMAFAEIHFEPTSERTILLKISGLRTEPFFNEFTKQQEEIYVALTRFTVPTIRIGKTFNYYNYVGPNKRHFNSVKMSKHEKQMLIERLRNASLACPVEIVLDEQLSTNTGVIRTVKAQPKYRDCP